MRHVAILGAGEIGAHLASALAASEMARDVRLIDEADRAASGKALDVTQAGPVSGSDTRVTGGSDLGATSGAAVVVVADRHAGGEWRDGDALTLVRRVVESGYRGPFVFAGPGQAGAMRLALVEAGIGHERLVGSAPEAALAAGKAFVALETGMSAGDVSLALLGLPPQWVIGWDDAGAAGRSLGTVLTPQLQARLQARLAAAWPPGPYALAAAAARVVEVLLRALPRRLSCFVAASAGRAEPPGVVALPVTLGPAGVVTVHEPRLTARERVLLDGAMAKGSAEVRGGA